MAGGTLFYLLIILLLEWLSSTSPSSENYVFLCLTAIVRYTLYTLAVWPDGRDELPAEG
jgi:hypothetical protein